MISTIIKIYSMFCEFIMIFECRRFGIVVFKRYHLFSILMPTWVVGLNSENVQDVVAPQIYCM